jgi:CotS family spore coat protein
MAELHDAVLQAFNLGGGRLRREKSYFICEKPEGLYKIGKTSDAGDHIILQYQLKEHLITSGYPWVDRYALTTGGQPFFTAGGENYVMTTHFRGKDTDFENWADFSRAMEWVARWHACARDVKLPSIILPETTQQPPLTGFFQKQAAELSAIAKRVRRQPRLSDFDVLFIKNAAYYADRINDAINGLEQTDYAAAYARALSARHFCHNSLKEESLTLFDGHVYITHYSDVALDLQLNDLCGLIRRYAQRAGRHAVPIGRLLESYHRIEPLNRSSLAILYVLLQFPWQFMRIINQYYSKKRTWTPNAMANRMFTVVSERDDYEAYINGLRREIY